MVCDRPGGRCSPLPSCCASRRSCVASLRWQALLEPAAHVPLGGVVAATMMGMTASTVAPMQAAEIVRPYVLSSQQGVDFSTTLATAHGRVVPGRRSPSWSSSSRAALWLEAGRRRARVAGRRDPGLVLLSRRGRTRDAADAAATGDRLAERSDPAPARAIVGRRAPARSPTGLGRSPPACERSTGGAASLSVGAYSVLLAALTATSARG